MALAVHPFTRRPQGQREPRMTPWIATAVAFTAIAAGMMDWTDGQWVAYITVIGSALGTLITGIFVGIRLAIREYAKMRISLEELRTAAKSAIPESQAKQIARDAAATATKTPQTPPES